MHRFCSLTRVIGILLLTFILVPACQAVDPTWIVPSAPGIELSGVAISHDGSIIVAGGDQLIVLSPEGKKFWSGWSGSILEVSRDGNYIATSRGQTVRLFNRQGIMLWDHSLGEAVTDLSMTPDGEMIAAGGGGVMQSWFNSGSGLGRNTTETIHDIKISPVKDQVIVGTTKALRRFNLSYVPGWYDDAISPAALEISGDGSGIVIPNGNHVRMYHSGGALLWDRAFPGGNIISLALSRDGSTIVAGRDDGTVIALDRQGSLLWTEKAGFWITSVSISDDGSTIGTGSIDNQISVFDRKGKLLGTYRTKNPVKSNSVAVSADGSLIVAVDFSTVYGFSKSGFIGPAAPSRESTQILPPPAGDGNITPVATPPIEGESPLSGNASFPETVRTPASEIPWVIILISLIFILAVRKK
ncbi:MAG: PQQ-binding-like beta-propeller repeat protein [Methanoregula sp.]